MLRDRLRDAAPGEASGAALRRRAEAGANVQLKDDAPAVARAVVADLDGHRDDKTVLATTKIGNFTAEKFGRWVRIFPQRQQVEQVIAQAPDSIVRQFVKNMVRNELILHAADSAKVAMDPQQLAQLRGTFAQVIGNAWTQLGIAPAQLSDSAKTEQEASAWPRRASGVRQRLLRNGLSSSGPARCRSAARHVRLEDRHAVSSAPSSGAENPSDT